MNARTLCVIPARGGSKGLPGKNVRLLAGLPLVAHSILCARSAGVDRILVSTDDAKIAHVAAEYGVDVPTLRPAWLAEDTTPMWPVIRHALQEAESTDGHEYGLVLLLDPTSPGRLPTDIIAAINTLEADSHCDGVIGVSIPDFSPLWHAVVLHDGYLADLYPEARIYARRQDVPVVYRINASVYLWPRRHVLGADDWRVGHLLPCIIPEERALHIDSEHQFELANLMIEHGLITLPWLHQE